MERVFTRRGLNRERERERGRNRRGDQIYLYLKVKWFFADIRHEVQWKWTRGI